MDIFSISFASAVAALSTSTIQNPSSAAQIKSDYYSPVSGVWQLQLEGELDCTENYSFQANQKMLVVSGDEWTYGTYRLLSDENVGLPVLVLRTIYDDNNVDCSGNQIDQSGEQFAAFFKKQSANSFELCSDEMGENCFMHFDRILP